VHEEIERTFLVDGPPPSLGAPVAVRQGYVALDGPASVRVRDAGGRFLLTVKGGSGFERTEVEVELDRERFDALWPLTDGRRIEKRRHLVDVAGVRAEVDVFGAGLAGLVMVDVEFASRQDGERFQPPPWFGREVTDDPAWSNASLALHGRPDRR
jgi:CYTH domain-containing protein